MPNMPAPGTGTGTRPQHDELAQPAGRGPTPANEGPEPGVVAQYIQCVALSEYLLTGHEHTATAGRIRHGNYGALLEVVKACVSARSRDAARQALLEALAAQAEAILCKLQEPILPVRRHKIAWRELVEAGILDLPE